MSVPFAARGVVEGFYGPPWKHAQRLEMAEFLQRHGMNTFMYAPKDDPYLRARWRDEHLGADLERFAELLNHCRAHEVELVPCLSPGLSIEYSSADDLALLIRKFTRLLALGVMTVGLLLDDIPLRLQHPADKAAFPTLAAAHVHLITEVRRALPSGVELYICPTQYFGTGEEEYITAMGGLPAGVHVMWTGRLICSPYLDGRDGEVIAATLGRKVTYWDNFPVNDVAMTHELHIGPYAGRHRDLPETTHGIIVNAMEYYENSKVGIAQAGAYLADPRAYEPEKAWARAVREVATGAAAGFDAQGYTEGDLVAAYELFADNCRQSAVYPTDAHVLGEVLDDYFFGVTYGDAAAAREDFLAVAKQFDHAARVLGAAVEHVGLIREVHEWVQAFRYAAEALAYLPDAFEHADTHARDQLERIHGLLRQGGRRVCGDVLDMTITDVLTKRDL